MGDYFGNCPSFTRLYCASFFRIVALTKIKGFDMTKRFRRYIPLMWGAKNGHGVMKILPRQERAGPDRPNKWSQTPLQFTAWNGHEGVDKMPPRRKDIDLHKPDRLG